MAKTGVLEAHQSLTDKPRYVKRCVADGLVRKLLAKRISRHLIQMLVIHEAYEIINAAPKVRPYDPADSGQISDPRQPDWFFTAYPIKDERTIYL